MSLVQINLIYFGKEREGLFEVQKNFSYFGGLMLNMWSRFYFRV